jgi:hypothetical protein
MPFRLENTEEASLGLVRRLPERCRIKLAGSVGSTRKPNGLLAECGTVVVTALLLTS